MQTLSNIRQFPQLFIEKANWDSLYLVRRKNNLQILLEKPKENLESGVRATIGFFSRENIVVERCKTNFDLSNM